MKTTTMIHAGNNPQLQKSIRKVLLICGMLCSLLYICTDIIAAISWKGYSYTAQSVSELSAAGAPTRPFVVLLYIIYDVLVAAFGSGVFLSADSRKRAQRVMGILLIGYGVVGIVGVFFPMHLRGYEKTLSDTLHIIFTSVTVLFILLFIGFGAAVLGKRFRFYSIATLIVLLIFGVLAGLDGPRVEAQLPTPWLGVTERVNIYASMVWMLVLAVILYRSEYRQDSAAE